jgi:hypothetical protein
MAKSTTYGLPLFDGLTVESYRKEKDWWEGIELKEVVTRGDLGLIVHYGERKCKSVDSWYKSRYTKDIAFICENPKRKGYEH